MVSERNRARMHLVLIVMPALLSGLRGPVVQPLYAADFQPRELLPTGTSRRETNNPRSGTLGAGSRGKRRAVITICI
jgi:hypothetical protein